MSERQASLIVADDLHVALNGKLHVGGIFTGDIFIPNDPSPANQLIFLFLLETDVKNPFVSVTLEVRLPGSSAPQQLLVPVPPLGEPLPNRTRQHLRWPMLMQYPVLRPGHIQAKVIHEQGEIIVSAPWIVTSLQTVPSVMT